MATSTSTPDAAISVRDIGKRYHMYAQPQDRLKQMLFGRFGRTYGRDFWALRHVNFEVAPGERFGVIGRNGSGKSTLLQMIAGTLAPTEGEVVVNGKVAALLELGSGFNPEFTGRENVFINGAIHGLTGDEVATRFEAIAAFADIGAFIDQPVKLYSSGMFVRLAFAVGTMVDADVLLIDEALAVGDVFFRQKCYRRLETLRERGVAIILVSHGMGDIEEFCDRALMLDRGEALFVGASGEAVKRYYLVESRDRVAATRVESAAGELEGGDLQWPAPLSTTSPPPETQVSDGCARCVAVAVTDDTGRACRWFEQGQRASFWYEFEILCDTAVPIAGLVIRNDKGTIVHGKSTLEYETAVPMSLRRGERFRVRQTLMLEIGVGEYVFELGLSMVDRDVYARRRQISHHEMAAAIVRLCEVPAAGQFAVGFRRASGHVQLLHHGIANLPGELVTTTVPAPRKQTVISVVTPSYNQGTFIRRTIESVLSQNVAGLEYFVFDGGSTDETTAILREYGDRIRATIEPDNGQADAVNKGLKAASGDIIGWLNSDDVYYPGAIDRVLSAFDAHPDVDVIYGEADHIDERDRVIERYDTQPFDYERLKDVCFLCQPAVFFRRSVVERYGPLQVERRYSLDYEYWLRVLADKPPLYLREKLAGSRLHAETKTLGSAEPVHREIIEMLLEKFGTPPARWIYNLAHVIVRERGLTRATREQDRQFVAALVAAAEEAFIRYSGGIPDAERTTIDEWRAYAGTAR